MRILLIEDDRETAYYISRGLAEEGHTTSLAYAGLEGHALFLVVHEIDAQVLGGRIRLPSAIGRARVLERVGGRGDGDGRELCGSRLRGLGHLLKTAQPGQPDRIASGAA